MPPDDLDMSQTNTHRHHRKAAHIDIPGLPATPLQVIDEAPQLNILTDWSLDTLLHHITTSRPRIHCSIPRDIVPLWNGIMHCLALQVFEQSDALLIQKLEAIFTAAPLFFPLETLSMSLHNLKLGIVTLPQFQTFESSNDSVSLRAQRAIPHSVSKALRILRNGQNTCTLSGSAIVTAMKKKILHDANTSLSDVTIPSKTTTQPGPILMRSLRLNALRRGIAPGSGLLKNEHLKVLTDGPAITLLQRLSVEIVTGAVPTHLRPILYGDPGIAIPKSNGDVRPICVGHSIVKLALKQIHTTLPRKQLVGSSQWGYAVSNGPQRCAALLQTALDNGKCIIKTDVTNAFNSVDRKRLAALLFDIPAAKPLYRYFIDRYLQPTDVYVFDPIGQYLDTITSNVGLCQGDVLAPLLFDIYLSDAPDWLKPYTCYQIHDDLYVTCDASQVKKAMEKIEEFFTKKGLSLNPSKTQIVGETTTSIVVGGIPISTLKTPCSLPHLTSVPHLDELPLQCQVAITRCLQMSWKYTLEATPKYLLTTLTSDIARFQERLLERLITPAGGDKTLVDQRQLYERPKFGGLGFTDCTQIPSIFNAEGAYVKPTVASTKTPPQPSQWYKSLEKGVAMGISTPFPLLTLVPVDKVLKISDNDYSAYIVTLLNCLKPKPFKCKLKGETLDLSASEYLYHHLTCISCPGGLRTFRHDLINEAMASVLRRHGASTQLEPDGWFLRTKPSHAGHDGPDMLISWGPDTLWTDMYVVNTHPHRMNSKPPIARINDAYAGKLSIYAAALESNVSVFPLGFSHLGVPLQSMRPFLSIIKSHARAAVRELHNICAVKAAIALGLFFKRISLIRPLEASPSNASPLVVSPPSKKHHSNKNSNQSPSHP